MATSGIELQVSIDSPNEISVFSELVEVVIRTKPPEDFSQLRIVQNLRIYCYLVAQ